MNFFHHPTVSRCAPRVRKLRLEPLEDRRMLAVFTVDNLGDAGLGSLRQAIEDANAAAGADTIEFQVGLSGTIALSTGEMTITDELTIDGPGDELLTIDAQQSSRILRITPESGPVTIEGLTLTGGEAEGYGGAILSETEAAISIAKTTISANSATRDSIVIGGGIYASGDLLVSDSTITGNAAIGDVFGAFGGGISADGNVSITNSTISNNEADGRTNGFGYGGGIAAVGNVTINNSYVLGNSATGSTVRGGGIFARGDVSVMDGTISGNTVTAGSFRTFGLGGGISAEGDVNVTASTISGNSVNGDGNSYGGAIDVGKLQMSLSPRGFISFIGSGDATITNSTISDNSAIGRTVRGGGINSHRDVSVTGSTIAGNSAIARDVAYGGGIMARDRVTIVVSNVSGNSARGGVFQGGYGGGVLGLGDMTVTNSVITGNSALGERNSGGGGIDARSNVTLTRTTITRNVAVGNYTAGGSGVSVRGTATITASTISNNTSKAKQLAGGGAIVAGGISVASSTISGNSVSADGAFGGGVWSAGPLTLNNTTISDNLASGGFFREVNGGGGGIYLTDGDSVTVENSIVAGNRTNDGIAPDLNPGTGLLTVRHSLIGDNTGTGLAPAPVAMPDADGNLIGTSAAPIDALLGPLQDNGGPTFTHALLAGSPAIDAGDPLFDDPIATDQRGYVRVVEGGSGQPIIDMGAYEFGSTLAGDGNGDGFVGDEDYTIWANNFGLSGDGIPGDYNNDGTVGPKDYTVWANNFGAGDLPSGETAAGLVPRSDDTLMSRSGDRDITGGDHVATSKRPSTPMLGVPPARSQSEDRDRTAVDDSDAGAAVLRRDKPGGSHAAAYDAAIQDLMIEGLGPHDPISRPSIDHIWALLNAGLFENDSSEMLFDVSESGR